MSEYDETEACTWCGGEGVTDEPPDPVVDGPGFYPCPACGGSGDADDQVVW